MPDAGESHVRGQVLERTSTLILEIADSVVIVLDVENTLERLLNYQVTKFFFFSPRNLFKNQLEFGISN